MKFLNKIVSLIMGNSINMVPSQLLLYATIATVTPITNYGFCCVDSVKHCRFLLTAVSNKMFARNEPMIIKLNLLSRFGPCAATDIDRKLARPAAS